MLSCSSVWAELDACAAGSNCGTTPVVWSAVSHWLQLHRVCWWSIHLHRSVTHTRTHTHARTHTHTRLTALFPGLLGWAGTRKVKPIWILLKQETVSDTGISWDIYKSAQHSRQTTTPAPHHSVFTGRMPFLPPNQQCQSTEGRAPKSLVKLLTAS